jgi:hypothetical protein
MSTPQLKHCAFQNANRGVTDVPYAQVYFPGIQNFFKNSKLMRNASNAGLSLKCVKW